MNGTNGTNGTHGTTALGAMIMQKLLRSIVLCKYTIVFGLQSKKWVTINSFWN